VGDVWAVPDATSRTIFHGVVDPIFFPRDEQVVNVSGTAPFDNAPGGSRASMAQMDAVAAPFGDIVALHDSHCFIPTTSALDLDVADLFHDVAGDPDLLALTPFDAVYFPIANQEHVLVTAENADWLVAELTGSTVSVPDVVSARPRLHVSPNPFAARVSIRLAGGAFSPVSIGVYDASGRRIARLAPQAGLDAITWDGEMSRGGAAPPGVYFLRLDDRAVGAVRVVRR
jgi:hypothetical protein